MPAFWAISCLLIEPRIGHDYGGNTKLLGQDGRVTRTRGGHPAAVACNDGIAALGLESRLQNLGFLFRSPGSFRAKGPWEEQYRARS